MGGEIYIYIYTYTGGFYKHTRRHAIDLRPGRLAGHPCSIGVAEGAGAAALLRLN